MGAKIFHIQDGIIPRFENVHYLSKRRSVCTRKDSLSDPAAKFILLVSADEVEQAAAGITYTTINDFSQFTVVSSTDMLQHPHRCKHIELSGNVPVVVFYEFDPLVQSFFNSPSPRMNNLLVRDIERINAYSVVAGHVE